MFVALALALALDALALALALAFHSVALLTSLVLHHSSRAPWSGIWSQEVQAASARTAHHSLERSRCANVPHEDARARWPARAMAEFVVGV